MDPFFLLAVLLTLAALSSYLNHRFIGLPTTVALMGISLLLALGLTAASQMGWPLQDGLKRLLHEVNLSQTLLGGALSFLLFAAALSVEIRFDPATRSGSGVPCSRLAQTSGIPSATTRSA